MPNSMSFIRPEVPELRGETLVTAAFYGGTLKYIKKKSTRGGTIGCFIATSSQAAAGQARPMDIRPDRRGPLAASIMPRLVHDMASLNTHYQAGRGTGD